VQVPHWFIERLSSYRYSFVPESVRWLIQKRRFEEARTIIRRMAKVNKKPVPDLDLLERISMRQNTEKDMEARYTYFDLFSTVTLASRTLVVMFCWYVLHLSFEILFTLGIISGPTRDWENAAAVHITKDKS
jgi:hypothetical protein